MKTGVGFLLPILACVVLTASLGHAGDEGGADVPPATTPAETPATTPAETPAETPATNDQPMADGTGATVTGPNKAYLQNPARRVEIQAVEIIFDIRIRYQAWHNLDQGNALAKEYNDDFLLRTRLGLWTKVNEHVNAMISFHDWRRFGENTTGTALAAPAVNTNFGTTLRQAWIEFVDLFRNQRMRFDMRVGRQTFVTGDERLISSLEWSQTGNLFDGISSTLAAIDDAWNVRLFYFRLEREDNTVIIEKLRHFFGAHADFSNMIKARTARISLLQAYLYMLKRDELNNVEPRGIFLLTYGFLLGGNFSQNFNWEVEAALQSGRFYTSYVQAFMLSFVANWTLQMANGYNPTFSLLVDWASGDNDSTDNAIHTFNPLFPDSHSYLGEMDQVGRANVRAIAVKARLPLPQLDKVNGGQTFSNSFVLLALHGFWLDNSHDNWYTSNIGNNTINPSGPTYESAPRLAARNPNAPHEMGGELDIRLNTRLFNAVETTLFFGHFWAGNFGDKTGVVPVPRANGDFDFAYLQLQLWGGAN